MEITGHHSRQNIFVAALCLGFCLIVLACAWVAEDAYITFRVIDNVMNGYGLRWNIHERVQVYTHPLWMFLELLLFSIWHNLFLVSIALGMVCTATALIVTLMTKKHALPVVAGFFLLPLLASKSFLDYTTAGMETSLNYLLFALFGYVITRQRAHRYFWFYAALILSLAMLTRLDMCLLYAPPLIYLAWHERRSLPWKQIALGLLPLLAWLFFSLFYYGFIFPNSKYAKINTGLSLSSYLTQGFYYTKFQLAWDMPGALILFLPLLILAKPNWFTGDRKLIASITAGIYGYCLYVLFIGGDYMAGRFWAVPIFACTWLWYVSWPEMYNPRQLLAFILAVGMAFAMPSWITLSKNKVIDARIVFRDNKLITEGKIRTEGEYYLAEEGRKLANKPLPRAKTAYSVGMIGYYAGPHTLLIDELALTDPLLARLPAEKSRFYIGHFRRTLPRGYVASLDSGSIFFLPHELAEYYTPLQRITSGDLLSMERLKTIVWFNLGFYDHWKQSYLDTP